jgi:cobalamin biosynthesis protein CobC
MLEHGGNLHDAVLRFGIPGEQWLDLSTGINPQPYPVPVLRADAWHRLPAACPELALAAQAYYGAPLMLPVAGTQMAIQALPRLRPAARVVVAAPSYAEHAHCWKQAGHAVREVAYDELAAVVDDCDVMVVCNPNNPTGATIEPAILLDWAVRLAERGGWLVVDEAFADMTPHTSVARKTQQRGLIVLRSIGKFFGLAGLRLGFVAAHEELLTQLAELIGPWSVSGPAQDIGNAALSDRAWQEATRTQLLNAGQRLQGLLNSYGIAARGTALFQWWPAPRPEVLWQHMARRGIWVRLFTQQARGIRLGLPLAEADWQRLRQAFDEWFAGEGSA